MKSANKEQTDYVELTNNYNFEHFKEYRPIDNYTSYQLGAIYACIKNISNIIKKSSQQTNNRWIERHQNKL